MRAAIFALLALLACANALQIGSGVEDVQTDVASAATARPPANWTAPWFCHELDCPPYTVLETSPAYEKRAYVPGVWVSTEVQAYFYVQAATQGFRRLFKYIDGGNQEGKKVPMTAPVATKIAASAGPFCKSNFTVSFYVPFDFQEDPPEPSDPEVEVRRSPAFVAYVGQSGGLVMDDWSVARLAASVTDALEQEGKEGEVVSGCYFFAGYDPPFRLTGRHSEVWIISKERPPQGPGAAAAEQ